MAYAVVSSVLHTTNRLLFSSDIYLVPPSRRIIKSAHRKVLSLERVLRKLNGSSKGSSRKRVNALDGRIREAVSILEDVLDSHLLSQFLLQSEEGIDGVGIRLSIDLKDLKQDIHSFTKMAKKLKRAYSKALRDMKPDEDADVVSSTHDFGGNKSKMVGSSDQFCELKDQVIRFEYVAFHVVPLVGMGGIGKTTLAKRVFEDPDVMECFNCRAWVTVGRIWQLEKVQRDILAQMNDKMLVEGDEKVGQHLKESLSGKKYLIVLDDVWDTWVWFYMERVFHKETNGSRVFLISRTLEVARWPPIIGFTCMRLLNKEESWALLCEKVFGAEYLCPSDLEKAGKKIAENCDGLPLTIVTVANLISAAEKRSAQYWKKVAEKENSVFMDACESISKVLFPSYDYLRQHLKAVFLYMGVFPQNYEIPRSKLINMWVAEGLFQPHSTQNPEKCARRYLDELVSNSLVINYPKSIFNTLLSEKKIKSCHLHSSWRYLCNREGGKNKFFHVLYKHGDSLAKGIENQRRLCVHNNILFGIKDVFYSLDQCASTARSLLCYGPYSQYPLRICLGLRLLRVLDALTIRFYEFPEEVLKLVQLRYLALNYDAQLPASISKLLNLQFLIVHPHQTIKSYRASLYLPIEIWDMKELKHLQLVPFRAL